MGYIPLSEMMNHWDKHNRPSDAQSYVKDVVELEAKAVMLEKLLTLRPAAEWHEDHGTVLWFHLPVQEPPYVGSGPGAGEMNIHGEPTTCARLIEEGWLTHWSPLPDPRYMNTTDGTEVHN